MAETMVVPQLGNSVESVVVLAWKIAPGDSIDLGDVVCEVETDKATMDVESTVSGTVLQLLVDAGEEVAVRAPLLVVGEAGETPPRESVSEGAAARDAAPHQPGEAEASGGEGPPQPVVGAASANTSATDVAPATRDVPSPASGDTATPARESGPVSPRARMRSAQRGIDPRTLSGSGPGGRIIERDVFAAAQPATAAARAAGIGSEGAGSGTGGRVTLADTRPAPAAAPSAEASSAAQPSLAPRPTAAEDAAVSEYETIRVTGVRKVIAERMLASLQQTAQLTLHSSADARALQRLRARIKAAGDQLGLAGVNINDMVMYAVAHTLGEFPELNAHFLESEIRRFGAVDLGFAVDTPRGLLVPTIRRAERLSLAAISRLGKELATRAIDGKSGPDDLAPATFTVTNLGAFGIERFTPVLNPPQVAILGIGSIDLKPVPDDDAPEGITHIPSLGLSLTIDHRAVDGAPGARFLKTLASRIAAFDLLLAR